MLLFETEIWTLRAATITTLALNIYLEIDGKLSIETDRIKSYSVRQSKIDNNA